MTFFLFLAALWLGVIYSIFYLLDVLATRVVRSDSEYKPLIDLFIQVGFVLSYLYAFLWSMGRVPGGR